jgi:acetyl esterase
MPLDPQVQSVLRMLSPPHAPPFHTLPIEVVRQTNAVVAALGGDPEPVARALDHAVPGPAGNVRVRVYTPRGSGPFALLVFFHGGGWVRCDVPTYDPFCRALANAAGCVVASVDYRLAPEHPFPAALEDGEAALRWAAAQAATLHCDPARVAVGGDSAGGNLAAVIARRARDQGGPPLIHQLLIYPVTDYLPDLPSYRENDGYLLTRAGMAWFWRLYLGEAGDPTHPDAVPMRAADLRGLPPALVVTAEFDPLRDEGEAYAMRLREAGVRVDLLRYPGMIHGFLSLAGILEQARRAMADIGRHLRAAYARL